MNTLRRLVGLQKDVVRIVRLTGPIQASKGGMRSKQQLNIQVMEKSLDKAFDVKKVKPKAVLLEVNSPGGVPAQCNMIFTRIRNLSEKNGIPVVTYVEDMAVSGGYWLALAGDEIYAEPNAMVGSIGAIFGMFGMMELFNKLGLELRLFTAGENKLRFDPSKPLKAKDVIWAENLLREVHENFISLVKERRPSLDVNHKTVFTGDVFTAKSAQKFGLVDHLTSDIRTVMQSKYGKDITFERIARISSWKEMLRPSASVEVDFDAQAMLASVQRNARLPQF